MNSLLNKIPTLDNPSKLSYWIKAVETLVVLAGLKIEDNDDVIALLAADALKDKPLELFNSLSEEDKASWALMKKQFNSKLAKKNTGDLHIKFFSASHSEYGSTPNFINKMIFMAKECSIPEEIGVNTIVKKVSSQHMPIFLSCRSYQELSTLADTLESVMEPIPSINSFTGFCNYCGWYGHIERVCRNKLKGKPPSKVKKGGPANIKNKQQQHTTKQKIPKQARNNSEVNDQPQLQQHGY